MDVAWLNKLRNPMNIVRIDNENNIVLIFGEGILKIPLSIVTSVNEQTDSGGVAFFPNPVSEILTLKNCIGYSNFLIFDMFGKTINKGDIKSNQINISSLQRGFYTIRIYSPDTGSFKNIQFIKD